jgi:GLPGLI family protein
LTNNYIKPYYWAIIFLVLFTGCDHFHKGKPLEGLIEYEVFYLNNESNIPTNVLPNKVYLKFKDKKSLTAIEGFMGLFSLTNITDVKKDENMTVLRVMDNKYFNLTDEDELPFFFEGLEDIDIMLVDDTKVIAGINCKKAIVSFPDSSKQPYEIYYTEEIKIKNPNKVNPYRKINGVLMQFIMRINNMEILLIATKYSPQSIPDEAFIIPKDYKKISKLKMKMILAKLLE